MSIRIRRSGLRGTLGGISVMMIVGAVPLTQAAPSRAEDHSTSTGVQERQVGGEDLSEDEAVALIKKADALESAGRYKEASAIWERLVRFAEASLGPNHPNTATSLNNLALLYDNQGLYSQAEPLYKRALAIREKALGPDHPSTATSLNNLAVLYNSQGLYSQAEPLYKRALAISEKALGPDHPEHRHQPQ